MIPDSLQIEKYVAIDDMGLLCRKDRALVHGYIDRIFLLDDETVVVDDLKTARSEEDNETERFCYVLLAMALHLSAKRFIFALHFLRTGHYRQWTYDVEIVAKGKKNIWRITETSPELQMRVLEGHKNPLLLEIKRQVAEIERIELKAIPGPHCQSWYGEPCQFLGNGCPLEAETEGVVDSLVPVVSGSAIARLRLMLEDGAVTTIDDESWALSGLIQLEGFCKRVRKHITEWSRAHGPIPVGDGRYGWVTTKQNEVDKVAALRFMLDGMTVEEIASVISISKTNLDKKISKRNHPQIREMCLAMAVTEVDSNPKFEAIREDKESD